MSYQVIARKWRPQTFEEVTGQEHITQTLRNAIEHDRLHHSYLFSGARGVGKTTTARLLAKALNCHKTDKPNVSPCKGTDADQCPSCLEISESRSIDVLEFDAASNTQVDKIREIILENINIAAARDRYKVFIIDEVHMLSTSSFNALLKTVEEPPPNVVFIMATTELHKVPDTITSRSQEFQFRTIPQQKIFDRLKLIAEAESIAAEDAALREIARSGEGSMRDAQSNFDQVISFAGNKIEKSDVAKALGIAGADMVIGVITAIAEKDVPALLKTVNELNASGHDLRSFSRDILALMRDLMVAKAAGSTEGVLDNAMLDVDQLAELSKPFSTSDLVRFFNSLAATESSLKDSSNPRYTLEIGLVKLTEMRRLADLEMLLGKLGSLDAGSISATNVAPPVQKPEPQPAASAATAAAEEKKTLKSEPTAVKPSPLPEEPPDFFDRPPLEEPEDFQYSHEPVFNEPPPERFTAPPTEAMPIAAEASAFDISFVNTLPSKLPPLTAEELEHTEDQWLDDTYDDVLAAAGDDLLPIASARELVAMLDPQSSINTKPRAAKPASNGIYDQFAPPPPVEDKDDDGPPIILSDDPTDEEIIAFAKSQAKIKRVMRIFRGDIIAVKRAN